MSIFCFILLLSRISLYVLLLKLLRYFVPGKTTTLGVLTGDIRPTGGQAYVSSHDVTGSEAQGVSMARQNTGFCPQVDPLIELMTGRETLRMFGRLRGIPKQSIVSVNV